MRLKITLSFFLIINLFFFNLSAQDTLKIDYKKYPDYNPAGSGVIYNPAKTKSGATRIKSVDLPSRVDNSEKIYFPPVFNQDQGSCGSASRIGYMFTHEINAFRNMDASLPENMYPTQFTWLLTDHGPGKEGMARDNGIPNMIAYGGRTYSNLFGNQTNEDPFGWMTGYDKWYSAMFNRITGTSNIGPVNIKTNADLLKGWLYDHNGDPAFEGRGGIAGIGVASAATLGNIGTGVYKGQKFVKFWGTTVDHALTIVGYDDEIWCDINEDSKQTPEEIGAWIIVNSWGSGWANKGFVYCPYSQAVPAKGSTSFWGPELYHVRANYIPQKTLKVKMTYSHRAELNMSIGVSDNLNATSPDQQIPLSHFTNCGWAKKDGAKYYDIPMLGQWADGIMHTEPMEFGYDISDLTAIYDQSKPLKYFFIINSVSNAVGTGTISECSIIDYSIDENGIEIPFSQKEVVILNRGRKTVLEANTQGEPIYPPINLKWDTETMISWGKPQTSSYILSGYKLYKNNEFISNISDKNTPSYTDALTQVSDQYEVSAVYVVNNKEIESLRSNKITKTAVSTATDYIVETGSMSFSNTGFVIPNVFANAMEECSIEFWVKPSAVLNWNFQIGKGWGTFLFHLNSGGGISVGFNTWNRLDKVGNVRTNQWAHIAITINGSTLKLYKDGQLLGTVNGGGNGMPALPDFTVGLSGNALQGKLDELRIWNKALSQDEIIERKDLLMTQPALYTNLVCYYQMDRVGTKLKDSKGGNDATFSGVPSATDYPLKETTNDFTLNTTSAFVGQVVGVESSKSPANTIETTWNCPESGLNNAKIIKPSFCFTESGTFDITKTVTISTGEKLDSTKTITVTVLPMPDPDFLMNKTTILTGERISLENKTANTMNSYTWQLTGALNESANTVNAAASYNKAGEYDITLTAKNASGEKSVTKKITVEKSAPKANFEVAQNYLIKGQSIKFTNSSLYDPDTYKWEFAGGTPSISAEKSPTINYQYSGKYRVKLTVTNEKGTDVLEKTRYIIVSNENPGNALSFDGDNDYLTISGLFSEKIAASPAISIEWWMQPAINKDECQIFGNEIFNITQNIKGGLSIGFGETDRMNVEDGTLETGSWDHFAFTYNYGQGVFYKNGKSIATKTFTTKSMAANSWTNGLRVGNSSNSINATIDELRVWNVLRTQEEVLSNMNNKLTNVASLGTLECYFTFDESASDTPKDESMYNRASLRQNIGPVGDMWSISRAFCNPSYSAISTFTPDSKSTYIIYDSETGARFNTSASARWAEFKTEFKEDGVIVGPCGAGTTFGLNNKYLITGSSEFTISKSGSTWSLKDNNTNLYARRDEGYMIGSGTDNRATLSSFDKNLLGNVRISHSTGLYMQISGDQWGTGGGPLDFRFTFEEVKPIGPNSNFSDLSGEPLQQARFTNTSQLLGTPSTLQGSVSYIITMINNRWIPLHFVADIEEITFQGRITSNDTVRLGGKMAIGQDFELRKYENGELKEVNTIAGSLPAGSYFIKLKNSSLGNKKVIFRTKAGVQFKDVPSTASALNLCGTDMARKTDIGSITGYYKINASGDKMIFTAANTVNVSAFEAYIPHVGNVEDAASEIDLNVATGITITGNNHIQIAVINKYIKIIGSESAFKIYNLNGIKLDANKPLNEGCYIVILENKAYKVIVK